jgi:predicted DNA-binding ribbon-helix-helix protein
MINRPHQCQLKQHHDIVRELELSFVFDKVCHCPFAVPNLRYDVLRKSNYGNALMKSSVIKRSIEIDGHKTSVSLEDAFWSGLKEIANEESLPLKKMVAEIDKTRHEGNLSSAIRLFVLDRLRTQLLTNPAHWHFRAQEARRLAQKLDDPEARAAKLKMADRYARLAARAMDRAMNGAEDSAAS